LRRWKEAALADSGDRKDWKDTTYWARAVGAAGARRTGAESDVKELTQARRRMREALEKVRLHRLTEKATDLREAEAWLAFAKGTDESSYELRAAADPQDKDGGRIRRRPAREMLADMLSNSSVRPKPSPNTKRS